MSKSHAAAAHQFGHVAGGAVQVTPDKFTLTFLDDVMKIDTQAPPAAPDWKEEVEVLHMKNDAGIEVTAMGRGGTLLQLTKNGKPYLWSNPNAAYYGQNTNNFALQRGIVLHGGCRFTAIAPEHGIYFDSDWKMDWHANDAAGNSKSITLTIEDTIAQRAKMKDNGSINQFNRSNCNPPAGLSKYPVTGLTYTYILTLNKGEEYVHVTMRVENKTDKAASAEAWMPMMLPAEEGSEIITKQRMMWRRDEWCFPQQPNMIDFVHDPTIKFPLQWEKMGIYYSWPHLDGAYHGVNVPSTGQGTIFVTDPSQPTFMKLWSWGTRKNFVRTPNGDDKGRPHIDYYECWCSNTSPAFFETASYAAGTTVDFHSALLPIESGLKGDTAHLQQVVEAAIAKAGVKVVNEPAKPINP